MLGRLWTPAEDEILRANYVRGAAYVAKLTGHSVRGVHRRAHKLRVMIKPVWTEREDKVIRNNWGHVGLAAIGKALNRTPHAVYERAAKIGLRVGSPDGFEYLKEAAERTGYQTDQLRRVLAFAGVRLCRTLSRTPLNRARSRHYVDPLDVDEAIAYWHKTETLKFAARRHGVDHSTLRIWIREVRELGWDIPAPPAMRKHWRLPSALFDEIVAFRRGTETLLAASRRVRVSKAALAAWLKEAGVARGKAKFWLLKPTAVDAVVAARVAQYRRGRRPNAALLLAKAARSDGRRAA